MISLRESLFLIFLAGVIIIKELNVTRLISLDTSSTKTGWSLFENGSYSKSGLINLDTKECRKIYENNSENRVRDMCLEICNVLDVYKPHIIVVEKLNVNRNMKATRMLSKIIGVVYGWSIFHNSYYYEIQSTQWRGQLGMQSSKRIRDNYKELSIEYVKNRFGIDVTDDESDAVCAGLGYIKMFTTENNIIGDES